MTTKRTTSSPANDNCTAWEQGRADGQAGKWSDEMANKGGWLSQQYLSGWIAGHESLAP